VLGEWGGGVVGELLKGESRPFRLEETPGDSTELNQKLLLGNSNRWGAWEKRGGF